MKIALAGIRGIPARYGGFETCVDRTSRLMAAGGHEVAVYNRTQHSETWPEQWEGVQLRYVARPGPVALHTLGHTWRVAAEIGTERFDVVHLYGVGNAPAILPLKRRGHKVVISVDAQDWAREKWGIVARNYLLLAARLATIVADAVVVDSRAIQQVYERRFGRPGHYIAYGAETRAVEGDSWLRQLGLKPRQYHLFVGRLTPEKRPHHLIEAYRRVRCSWPLLIVGSDPYDRGYDAYLRRLADERVRFVGPVYDDGFHQLCHHCYLYLTASVVEGTSPALLQAMGQGAATLVNGIPANRETIGDAGLAYATDDVDDLVRLWQQVIDEPEALTAVRQAATQRVRRHYNWPLVTEQLLALYREVAE